MEKDLKWIKKHYGEKMMHLCRDLFPVLLEKENLLSILLEEHFPHNRHLAEDIENEHLEEDFRYYILSHTKKNKEKTYLDTGLSATELMSKAGYTLHPECLSENDIQTFKKYYQRNETLCTFNGGRLNTCRVWFAIKDGAEELIRQDFVTPKRQDEYGTSVISIQFSKSGNFCSIKNRYNHSVTNPDNTFFSDLDNIIPGLSTAFEKDFGVKDNREKNSTFELNNYVCVDGKYYHYNYELNGIYYCDNNTIIDNNQVIELPQHQMLIDYFIVDFKEKTVELYDNTLKDSFNEGFKDIEQIKFENNSLKFSVKDGTPLEINLSDRNTISGYKNDNITSCKDDFLYYNKNLESISLENLELCGDSFLYNNERLASVNIPKLKKCGNNFLYNNENLESLSFENLIICGHSFISCNQKIKEVYMPNLKVCGNDFLECNNGLTSLSLPNLEFCGHRFLRWCENLKTLYVPNLERCGNDVLLNNKLLESANFDSLQECGDWLLFNNTQLKYASLPNLETCKSGLLCENTQLEYFSVPKLKKIGNLFLYSNENLKQLIIPNNIKYNRDIIRLNGIIKSNNLIK